MPSFSAHLVAIPQSFEIKTLHEKTRTVCQRDATRDCRSFAHPPTDSGLSHSGMRRFFFSATRTTRPGLVLKAPVTTMHCRNRNRTCPQITNYTGRRSRNQTSTTKYTNQTKMRFKPRHGEPGDDFAQKTKKPTDSSTDELRHEVRGVLPQITEMNLEAVTNPVVLPEPRWGTPNGG